VASFAELLEMGADMEGSPANERLTRQVQQFTTVRVVIFGKLAALYRRRWRCCAGSSTLDAWVRCVVKHEAVCVLSKQPL